MMLSYDCSEKQATSQPIALEHTTLSFKGPRWQSIGALSAAQLTLEAVKATLCFRSQIRVSFL